RRPRRPRRAAAGPARGGAVPPPRRHGAVPGGPVASGAGPRGARRPALGRPLDRGHDPPPHPVRSPGADPHPRGLSRHRTRRRAPAGPPRPYGALRALAPPTICRGLRPSGQLRLRGRAAASLEALLAAKPGLDLAGETAVQYHRSREMAGAERGVPPALVAADKAQTTGGYDEAAILIRMALDMLPEGDERRPRLLGRLGIVRAWALDFAEA